MSHLKKIITFLIFPLATVSLAQQYSGTVTYPDYSPDIRNILIAGIKTGFDYSDIYAMKGQNLVNSPMFGPVMGGYLSIPINTFLGFQPELLYSEKGYSAQGTTGEGQGYSFIDRLNYLDLPLLLQIKPTPYFYLLGGPEYSYLLSQNYTFVQDLTYPITQEEFTNEHIRHNYFGLIIGADVNYARLALGFRVAWNLVANNGNSTSTLPRYRNFWEQLTIGYRL
jgi:hypothetical protein